jgi:hypothetical protein
MTRRDHDKAECLAHYDAHPSDFADGAEFARAVAAQQLRKIYKDFVEGKLNLKQFGVQLAAFASELEGNR